MVLFLCLILEPINRTYAKVKKDPVIYNTLDFEIKGDGSEKYTVYDVSGGPRLGRPSQFLKNQQGAGIMFETLYLPLVCLEYRNI
ncbi:MAG: hypothetical protein H6Q68_3915 [Firmicutes bacterium]|nr:hypothetical protein [Bacillota bacterium]